MFTLTTTNAQDMVIAKLFKDIMKHDSHVSYRYDIDQNPDYEYKRFELKKGVLGCVWLFSEVGLIDDEGTMAEIFGRTSRMILIGKRGGVSLHNASGKIKKHLQPISGYKNSLISVTW